MKKFFKILLIIIGAFFLFVMIITIVSIASLDDGDSSTTTVTQTEDVKENSSEWEYSESIDKMDNSKTNYAILESENEIDFDFPYNGGSTFYFAVRKTNGNYDMYLNVSKGQFDYNLMNEHRLRVKFDDGEAFNLNFSNTSDGSTEIIFPQFSSKLLAQLKKSKKMMIEAPFAFAGRKVIYFETENLDLKF